MAISPSENLDTEASPNEISKCLTTRCANSGFALPVNTIKLSYAAIFSPDFMFNFRSENVMLPSAYVQDITSGIIRIMNGIVN